MAGETKVVRKDITAENQFSDWLQCDPLDLVALSIVPGTATTIHVQRTFDGGVTNEDVTDEDGTERTYTGKLGVSYLVDSRCLLRMGCKPGNYGSGTTSVRLSKG